MLPQRRKRAWSVLLHQRSLGLTSAEAARVLDAIFQTVEKQRARPVAAKELLLKTAGDTVEAELRRRQACCRGGGDAGGCGNSSELHQSFMHSKGVSWAQLRAPASTEESAWFQMCTQREKEIIAFAMQYKPRCSRWTDRNALTGRLWRTTASYPPSRPVPGTSWPTSQASSSPSTDSCWGWRASCFRVSPSSSCQSLKPKRAARNTRTWQATPSRPPAY